MITRWRKKNKAYEANDSPENTTFSRISKPYNAPLTSSPQQQSKLPTWKSPKPGSINCIPRMNGVNPNAVGCTTFLMVSICKIHLSLTRLRIVSIFYCIVLHTHALLSPFTPYNYVGRPILSRKRQESGALEKTHPLVSHILVLSSSTHFVCCSSRLFTLLLFIQPWTTVDFALWTDLVEQSEFLF